MTFARVLVAALSVALAGAARGACRVETTGLPFGQYDFLAQGPLDAVGEITVTCDAPVSFALALESTDSRGGHLRTMHGPRGGELRYLLFHDGAYRQPWLDGTQGDHVPLATGRSNEARMRVYGRILPRQPVPPGEYEDEIVLTVLF